MKLKFFKIRIFFLIWEYSGLAAAGELYSAFLDFGGNTIRAGLNQTVFVWHSDSGMTATVLHHYRKFLLRLDLSFCVSQQPVLNQNWFFVSMIIYRVIDCCESLFMMRPCESFRLCGARFTTNGRKLTLSICFKTHSIQLLN